MWRRPNAGSACTRALASRGTPSARSSAGLHGHQPVPNPGVTTRPHRDIGISRINGRHVTAEHLLGRSTALPMFESSLGEVEELVRRLSHWKILFGALRARGFAARVARNRQHRRRDLVAPRRLAAALARAIAG